MLPHSIARLVASLALDQNSRQATLPCVLGLIGKAQMKRDKVSAFRRDASMPADSALRRR
ncbi:hypothetical protein BQ8482_110199 [Mesorhizobium delmotii]|uniref:Uncharacterized protein n=1 Tax=Mesorhizobium delmotii TaxID=1631247 RepID=A0A2P9AAX2_9HYPH|nr:hypothetical protein BQ8482_110199 [Mesorhizobium delmotii]